MAKPTTVYVGLRSGAGDRVTYLRAAVSQLSGVLAVEQASHLYSASGSVDITVDDPLYTVLRTTTDLNPMKLVSLLRRIEQGITRGLDHFGMVHALDIEILLYGMLEIESPGLDIPHAKLATDAQMLKPLIELAPGLVHPLLNYTLEELLRDCDDADDVRRYPANITPPSAKR